VIAGNALLAGGFLAIWVFSSAAWRSVIHCFYDGESERCDG
jgi:hypothetical protein